VPSILVVDDERVISDLLSVIFTEEGYRVTRAGNGREGLERLAVDRPDVILSDLMMPVLDGVALGHALQDDPTYRTIPLVFMSAAPLSSAARACVYAAFVSKPFVLDDLLDVVARVIATAPPH